MEYTTLGRTGLRVSVAGLGCGGFSRLGLSTGGTEASAIAVIHAALDLGVNLLDTAAPYDTESVVGKAIKSVPRDRVVIATKSSVIRQGERWTAERVVASLDNSLRELGIDCIDVFQLHAVPPQGYDYVREVIAPVLLKEKEKGKFRFLGITETAPNDLEHRMLLRAIPDGLWDVAMVAFHLMNQNTREAVFPATLQHRVGTLLMFAVRRIFAHTDRVVAAMQDLAAQGQVPQSLADEPDPLGFLIRPDGASSLTDAAYRYVRHEPGVDVVLFGTGDLGHLRANVRSILRPPLPQADRDRLRDLFGHLRGVGLIAPSQARAANKGAI
jgi:aryl-alcohol dehydrogenase-like predicted oxidoreductase